MASRFGKRRTLRSKARRRNFARRKTRLGLPDLDHAKAAVLASLRSPESQRSYRHAIDEFVGWYCSEPRLSFNKTVVTRYRIHLEDRRLAPGTTNVRLAAIRRLAYEAADCGLLSPELTAGIRRVKGAKRLGGRLGNWLAAEQARAETLKGKRDRATLQFWLGVGFAGGSSANWTSDLVGKAGHVRTVPVPDWVKRTIDATGSSRRALPRRPSPDLQAGPRYGCAPWIAARSRSAYNCNAGQFGASEDDGGVATANGGWHGREP
jgi:hypothetical protein